MKLGAATSAAKQIAKPKHEIAQICLAPDAVGGVSEHDLAGNAEQGDDAEAPRRPT